MPMKKMEKQISRVKQMEELLDQLKAVNSQLNQSLDAFCAMQAGVKKLGGYYGSAAWRQDVADDEDGLFPLDLKRGVLSEDGAYNALAEYRDTYVRMLEIVSNAMKKGTV